MAVRCTAAQLRELKRKHDREAIDSICSDIGTNIIGAAKEGESSVTAVLSNLPSKDIVMIIYGQQYMTYGVIVNDSVISGCVESLNTLFPGCVIYSENIEGSESKRIIVDWSDKTSRSAPGVAERPVLAHPTMSEFEQLRTRVAELESGAVQQIRSGLIDIVANFGKIVETLPGKKD